MGGGREGDRDRGRVRDNGGQNDVMLCLHVLKTSIKVGSEAKWHWPKGLMVWNEWISIQDLISHFAFWLWLPVAQCLLDGFSSEGLDIVSGQKEVSLPGDSVELGCPNG